MKKTIEILILITICLSAKAQEEIISFQSENLTLNGTLSIPENSNSPFPLAILVHGSGPSDRNQTITLNDGNSFCLYPNLFNETIRNFKDISDHLADNGIAVLRYDKRTFTHGQTLNESEILVSDFITDIESALKYCETRLEIDLNNIFLIGHSQGSSLIPIAATNSGAVKGLISLAGPTTPIDSLLPEQIRHLFVECANDPNTGDNVANQLYDQFEQIRNSTFPLDEQVTITIPGNPNPIPQGYGSFWSNWIDISDKVIQNYNNSNLKSLIIHGNDDVNVPVDDANDFKTISNSEIQIYQGINHFLTTDNDNKVSDEILNDISSWINSCVTTSIPIVQRPDRIKIYRIGSDVIIESEVSCKDCLVEIYQTDGKRVKSKKMNGIRMQIKMPVENSLKVVVVKDNQSIISKLVK